MASQAAAWLMLLCYYFLILTTKADIFNVFAGYNLAFCCPDNGTINWTKNGLPLEITNNSRLTVNNTESSTVSILRFATVLTSDGGVYTCTQNGTSPVFDLRSEQYNKLFSKHAGMLWLQHV